MGFVDVKEPMAHRGRPRRRRTLSRTDHREAGHLRGVWPWHSRQSGLRGGSRQQCGGRGRRGPPGDRRPGTWRHRCQHRGIAASAGRAAGAPAVPERAGRLLRLPGPGALDCRDLRDAVVPRPAAPARDRYPHGAGRVTVARASPRAAARSDDRRRGHAARPGLRDRPRSYPSAAPVRSDLLRSTRTDWHGGVIAHLRGRRDVVAHARGTHTDPLLVLRSE